MVETMHIATKLKKNWMVLLAYVIVALPVLLFFLFWLRPVIGIPLSVFLIYGAASSFADEKLMVREESGWEAKIKIIVVLLIIILWVLSSGVGGSVFQYPDHTMRNSIYQILVDEPWPVTMAFDNGTRMLTYYIGFWLPASLAAKFTSYGIGLIFQQLWAIASLFLVWRFLSERQGRYRLWFLVLFIFFGGLDAVGKYLTGSIYLDEGNSYEWWAMFFNYPGMSSHLFWAYNQAIYGWIFYMLIMRQEKNRNLLFIWSLSLLSCTFPAIGLIPFAIYKGIVNSRGEDGKVAIAQGLKRSLSLCNLLGLVIALFVTSYLVANSTIVDTAGGTKNESDTASTAQTEVVVENDGFTLSIEGTTSGEEDTPGSSEVANKKNENASDELKSYDWTTQLWIYLWFALLEFGIFFMFIFPIFKKNGLYWMCLVVLLIIPWIKVGYHLDFCERASIPAMMCLMEMIITAFIRYREEGKRLLPFLLALALIAGSITTLDTIKVTMSKTSMAIENIVGVKEEVDLESVPAEQLMRDYNFSSDDDSFFYKYLSAGEKE